MKGLSLLNALFFHLQISPPFIFSSLYTPVVYLYTFLFYPFFLFTSILSFLLYGFCCVCVKPSMGAVLAEQQSLRTHTRSLDTHCIQLTLHTQSISKHTHTQETPSRTIPCWQVSHHPPPRQPELHFTVRVCDRSAASQNIPNYFLQVSSQSCSLRRSLLIPHRSGSTKRRW